MSYYQDQKMSISHHDTPAFSGVCKGNEILLRDIRATLHDEQTKTRFESGSSSSQSSAVPLPAPRGGNLKSSLESLTSGLPPPPRKTVTFKGDVQTIQCSPEEEQERRCWRHQPAKVEI